jgi:hypothetical protein
MRACSWSVAHVFSLKLIYCLIIVCFSSVTLSNFHSELKEWPQLSELCEVKVKRGRMKGSCGKEEVRKRSNESRMLVKASRIGFIVDHFGQMAAGEVQIGAPYYSAGTILLKRILFWQIFILILTG